MNNKIVLVVDEDSLRAEKLLFIVRLGGYLTRTFGSTAAALNWSQYGCSDGDALCLLFNNPGDINRAAEIVATWSAAGMTLPVVLLQRGQGNWNRLLAIAEKDLFFVCEPESVMQTLEILTAITANNRRSEPKCSMAKINRGEVVQCT
jgi:DNA-binding NtrC family response regulator